MFKFLRHLRDDLRAVLDRDPAQQRAWHVILLNPGFHAVTVYRLAHPLWRWRLTFLALLLSRLSQIFTGIDIHPGARIGRSFFIDHGSGVVIGETSEIGDRVTLYQGVTLGGVRPSVQALQQRGTKRHPTIENDVIIGSGAQVLGAILVGAHARVGAGSVVTRPVAPGTTVIGVPAAVLASARRTAPATPDTENFSAYGIPQEGLHQPKLDCASLEQEVIDLRCELAILAQRLQALEQEPGVKEETVRRRA